MTPPGLATDRFVRASFSVERREDGFAVVETPRRRDFWFGNMLVLDRAPAPADYDAWLARHGAFFAGTDVAKRVVQWETSGPCDDAPAPARPEVSLDVSAVLVSDTTPEASPRADVTLRTVAGDADWSGVHRLERAETAGAPAGFADFYAWSTQMVRLDVERGIARVVGAFEGGELVAFAGAYACAQWIRLTTPITAEAYRRRGLFSALFACAVREARGRFPAARIVVVAEARSAPDRLYRSLGFEGAGYQFSLVE